MVDCWDDGLFWDTVALEIVYDGHNHSVIFMEDRVIRICLYYICIFIFNIKW